MTKITTFVCQMLPWLVIVRRGLSKNGHNDMSFKISIKITFNCDRVLRLYYL